MTIANDAHVLGGNDFTRYGFLAYPERRAMSIQAHPEFATEYITALIENRRGERFDPATADAAIATLAGGDDRERVGGWMRSFLREG